ncbi:hypothetical protein SEPCBS57363_000354 [Sporothrix epigloea]|uniref:PhoD-like phosphatase domain-containing protein n=1 Tax=Sporothrix epigloea TaxID=1892477 RepID=A0ABP0D477_9PEZI
MDASTTYWGDLPSPRGSRDPRNPSAGTGQAHRIPLDAAAHLQVKPNRMSVQTTVTDAPTESTISPFVSPTSSPFPDTGLAPRPSSLTYNGAAAALAAATGHRPAQRHQRQLSQDGAPADRNSRRQHIRNHSILNDEAAGFNGPRDGQELSKGLYEDVDPPPAAPDVPRGPPLSYRPPGYAGAVNIYPPISSPSRAPRGVYLPPNTSFTGEPVHIARAEQYYAHGPTATSPLQSTAAEGITADDQTRNLADNNSGPETRRNSSNSGGAKPQSTALQQHVHASGAATSGQGSEAAPQALQAAFATDGSMPQPRRVSTGSSTAGRQHKKYEVVRSPLQKLELTLDSITKEEKRARVAAAEQVVRDKERRRAEAGRGTEQQQQLAPQQQQVQRWPLVDQYPQRQQAQLVNLQPRQESTRSQPSPLTQPPSHQQQQVRFRDHATPPNYGEPRPLLQPDMSPAEESYLPVTTQRVLEPQYSNTPPPPPPPPDSEKPRNLTQPVRLPATRSDVPQRNLSFREPAVFHDSRLHAANDQSLNLASPSADFNMMPHRQNVARSETVQNEHPPDLQYSHVLPVLRPENSVPADAVPRTMPAHAELTYALGQAQQSQPPQYQFPPQGPAKLVKSPSQRKAPPNYPHRTISQPMNGIVDDAHNDTYNGPNISGNNAQSAPAASTAPTTERKTARFVDDVIDNEPQPSQPVHGDRHFDDSHHHRISNMVYRARSHLQPGQGTYLPPTYLEEWKQGTVGTLAGGQLDLSDRTPASEDSNKAWWEKNGTRRGSTTSAPPRTRKGEAFDGEYDEANGPSRFKPPLHLFCGPLLRYCGIRNERSASRVTRNGVGNTMIERQFWRGSVMIVTRDEDSSYEIAPTLRLFSQPLELLPSPPTEVHGTLPPEYVDPLVGHPKLGRNGETLYVRPVEFLEQAKDLSRDETDDGLFEKIKSPVDGPGSANQTVDLPGSFAARLKKTHVDGEKTGKYSDVRGFRLHVERGVTFWRFNIEVELQDKQQRIAYRINRGPSTGFWVPAIDQSMHIMFHSCNGFSLSVDPNQFSGPDPLWRDVLNTHQTQPFHVMIGGGDQIYNDAIMNHTQIFHDWLTIRNPVTKGNMPLTPEMQDEMESFYLNRYAMWFSQGLFSLANSQIPMVNMYDDHDIIDGFGSYPHHFMSSPVFAGLGSVAFKYYMLFQHQSVVGETEDSEPSWILGNTPGPYIKEVSRSTFMHLGAKVALLAVDCRTERTREEVLNEETWKHIIDRCYLEIEKGKTEHLLVQLGIPIAYPRLVWLENILTSRLMGPVKLLGKAGLLGKFLNHFDGGVEILDDLDDHWTAKSHKDERKVIIEDLQDLAADKSVRITILSGDVHLAAIGQFYSNAKQGLAKHKDFRYMPNVISSAIANTPPPDIMADILNKRNKVHHFDKETDEVMIPMFAHGVDGKPRNNKTLLPHRNWCSIQPYAPGNSPSPTPQQSEQELSFVGTSNGSRSNFFSRVPSFRRTNSYSGEPSRPPLSGGGSLLRKFSRGRRSTDDLIRRPAVPPESGLRSSSVASREWRPSNLLRRLSSRRKQSGDGGSNGNLNPEGNVSPQQRFEQQAYQQSFVQPQQLPGAPQTSPKTHMGHVDGQAGFSHSRGRNHSYAAPFQDGVRANGAHMGRNLSGDQSMISSEEDMLGNPSAEIRGGAGSISSLPGHGYGEYASGDESFFSVKRRPAGPGYTHLAPDAPGYPLRTQNQQMQQVQQIQQPPRAPQTSGGALLTMSDAVDANAGPPPRPFYRTPTGLTARQLKKASKYEVNLEGGLDIRLNVEINPKDPSGITVPYRLVVPRLWYTYESDSVSAAGAQKSGVPSGIKRLLSIGRRKPAPAPEPEPPLQPTQQMHQELAGVYGDENQPPY